MAVTVITLLALIVAFIFTLQQMSTLPAQPLQLYVSKQWVNTNTPGGNAVTVSLPITYTQWYKIVATGVVDSSDADFEQTVAVLKDYNMSLSGFSLRTSGTDKPAAYCLTIGIQTVGIVLVKQWYRWLDNIPNCIPKCGFCG